MKTAYICSPYAGDVQKNKEYARMLCKWAINHDLAPICPHLYITEVMDDQKPTEMESGLKIALELLQLCDVVIVGTSFGISEGMLGELRLAYNLGKEFKEIC